MSQNINNVRVALKMMSVIQNLILDLKEMECRGKTNNPHIDQTTELLIVKKKCDINVEILNLTNFIEVNKVDMNILNM